MTKTLLVVAAAIYDSAGRVLLAQRPAGKAMAGLWEFPGGKIEMGETPEQALMRELEEELQITLNPQELRPITFASYSYDEFHLLMPLFELRGWSGHPNPVEGQTLAWVHPIDLHSYPAPAADIPLFDVLITREGG